MKADHVNNRGVMLKAEFLSITGRSSQAAAALAQRPVPQRLHELTLPKPGGLSAAQAGRIWIAAAWAPQQPASSPVAQLVCSGLGGER